MQRCRDAKVMVDDVCVGQIDFGLVLLVGFTVGDSRKEIEYLVDKVLNLRIFNDEALVMNRSLLEVGGSILSVSQFTLYADARKGRRPSYVRALGGEQAAVLYEMWNEALRARGIKVATGVFGADMQVQLVNDGPVTIWLEKEEENDGK